MLDVPVDDFGSDYSDTGKQNNYVNTKPGTLRPYGMKEPQLDPTGIYAPIRKCTLTKWTSWSQSSVSCGDSRVSRNRACAFQGQICGNADCSGQFVDHKNESLKVCEPPIYETAKQFDTTKTYEIPHCTDCSSSMSACVQLLSYRGQHKCMVVMGACVDTHWG